MTGLVYWDVDGNRQYNAGRDLGLSGATLTLRAGDAVLGSTTTDQTGGYRFAALEPNTYMLQAAPPHGFALRATVVVLPVQANRTTPINFAADIVSTWTPTPTSTLTATPEPPTETPTATITLAPTERPTTTLTPSATPDVFTARGIVWVDVDGDGQQDSGEAGLGGARLELVTDVNGDGMITPVDPIVRFGFSKSNGEYALAGIPRGAYVLREINPSGYRSTTPDEVIVLDQPARLFFVMDFGDRPMQNGLRVYLPVLIR